MNGQMMDKAQGLSRATTTQKTFAVQENSELKVSGTSTIHDWEISSKHAIGSMTANVVNGTIADIVKLTVQMKSEHLQHEKDGMNTATYQALKTDKHENIQFQLESATKNDQNWRFSGSFTVAGTSQQVAFDVQETALPNGEYLFIGGFPVLLSHYGITPPTAMGGTVKTGDAVKIKFKIKFK